MCRLPLSRSLIPCRTVAVSSTWQSGGMYPQSCEICQIDMLHRMKQLYCFLSKRLRNGSYIPYREWNRNTHVILFLSQEVHASPLLVTWTRHGGLARRFNRVNKTTRRLQLWGLCANGKLTICSNYFIAKASNLYLLQGLVYADFHAHTRTTDIRVLWWLYSLHSGRKQFESIILGNKQWKRNITTV